MKATGQLSRGRRQGNVFAIRIPPEQRAELETRCAADGFRALGPWLIGKALGTTGSSSAGVGTTVPGEAVPGTTGARCRGSALPGRLGNAEPAGHYPPIAERLILDLCAGSGSWSEPYARAGYPVRRVTLPRDDVRTFVPPRGVWGVLAAPPCTEFSLAKNGQPRDFVQGMACVNACLRIVLTAAPQWWALENPVGLLGRWLGEPSDVFEPYDFGDPWSKRTALWGSFVRAERGPRVPPIDGGGPICSICHPDNPRVCSLADHRAITAPGFARAFFEANQ